MAMHVDVVDEAFVVDAKLIAELLDLPATDLPSLMRSGAITSVCETGIGPDQGTFRLNLFYRARHVRIRIDKGGRILRRSIVDFGDEALRRTRRSAVRPPLREEALDDEDHDKP